MGFLIDAAAHRDVQTLNVAMMRCLQMLNLAEIIVRTYYSAVIMQGCC